MDFAPLYWHWVVFGIALACLEIFIPSFTILWFGAGAVLVGGVLFIFPELSLAAQVFLWAIASSVFTGLWFKYLRPLSVDKTMAGLSLEAIQGEVGQVIMAPTDKRRGILRFPAPVLGSDEWQFICEDTVAVGDRVRVKDVSGNSLIVSKH
ncbi:MAG: hypothetical protein CSA54_02810 [Gammaproteobacteria bacterium]|nr:MAG: hypothetical protein CSA54_02810 [Gammaproteobacteria bacterium]